MSSTTNPTPVTAVSASTFDQSIGVNIHVENYWSNYANTTLVENELAYLGIDQVRDKFVDWSNVQSEYAQLAAAGVKFDLSIPVYNGNPDTVNVPEFISMVNQLEKSYPGSVIAMKDPMKSTSGRCTMQVGRRWQMTRCFSRHSIRQSMLSRR